MDGLVEYLHANSITHIVDATHPFAAQMSQNAAEAAAITSLPLTALSRAPWTPEPDDAWVFVKDVDAAARAIGDTPAQVFLAIGRQSLHAFCDPRHTYLLRLVDVPRDLTLPPNASVEIAKGPFDVAGDTELLRRFGIDTVVSKNSGGTGARAKLIAARALGLRVIMIDRPSLPMRQEFHDPPDVIRWLAHSVTDRGV